MNEFYVGGPECFGFDVSEREDAQQWANLTPAGQDPCEFMSQEEKAAYEAHEPPIVSS